MEKNLRKKIDGKKEKMGEIFGTSFDNIKVSSIVAEVSFTSEIDLMNAVSLIQLYYPKQEITYKRKKIKFPPVMDDSMKTNQDYGHCFNGDIIYAGYLNIKRGFVRSTKQSLKNSITVDIASGGKFVNCRIFKDKMHITGANSISMTESAANILLINIKHVQYILNKIKLDYNKSYKTIQWVIEKSKGNEHYIAKNTHSIIDESDIISPGYMINYRYNVYVTPLVGLLMAIMTKLKKDILPRLQYLDQNNIIYYILWLYNSWETYKSNKPYIIQEFVYIYNQMINTHYHMVNIEGRLITKVKSFIEAFKKFSEYFMKNDIYTYVEKKSVLKCPNEFWTRNYPEYIDSEIADYIISLIPDYTFHDVYIKQLNWLVSVDTICDINNINIVHVKTISYNYNYSLGHNLYFNKFINEIENLNLNNMLVSQDEHTDKFVTVHIPYVIPDHLKDKISKKDYKLVHTFTIYENGSVTQSGPHPELNCIAYNIFILNVSKIINNVISVNN